jgi:formylglycine-generating enzyme required for sulfatase activity
MAAIDYNIANWSGDGITTPRLREADVNAILSAKMPTDVNYTGYPGTITVYDYIGLGSSVSTTNCMSASNYCWNLVLDNNINLSYGGVLTANDNLVWYPLTDKDGNYTTFGESRERDNYPVSSVCWYGSILFCLWLGGSLPTDFQWEYAARQTSADSTDNSMLYAGSSSVDAVAWYTDNSDGRVHEVGKKAATGKGLYDMTGNLWEWCIEDYGAYGGSGYSSSLTMMHGSYLVSDHVSNDGKSNGAPLYNPVHSTSDNALLGKIFRGGSWVNSTSDCSLARRNYTLPNMSNNNVGFRSIVCP